jgi:nucleotide-binding universal stress UspA family protein
MKLILALDGSDDSNQSLDFLKKLPFHEKPAVTIVTALLGYPYPFHRIPEAMLERMREVEMDSARQNFERALAALGSYCSSIEHVVERRHPSKLILDVARERQADLIVMGARGHSAIYRVLLGSSADHIVNHAQCSVLLVRQAEEKAETDSNFRVLVAYDGSAHANIALEQMKSLDWNKDRDFIHVAMMHERPSMLPDDVVHDADMMSSSEDFLRNLCANSGLNCSASHSVKETYHVGSGITSKVDREHFDLLFVGSSSRSELSRIFLGSTSRYLLHHSKCSVWIAREQHWETKPV